MNLSRIRVHYFGLGPVLIAVLVALTLTSVLWPKLSTPEKYPDLVVGRIAWDAVNKNGDFRALFVLLASAAVLTLAISAVCHHLAPEGRDTERGRGINQFLLFSLVPAGWRLAVACLHQPDQLPPLRFLSSFPLGAVLVLLFLRRHRQRLQSADIFVVGGATLIAPLMAAFSALAVPLAIIRLAPASVDKVAPYASGFTAVGVGAALLGLIAVFICSTDLEQLNKRVLRCLTACQYALPLLLFDLLPTPLSDVEHHFRHPYPIGLVATLSLLAAFGVWRMIRRFRSAAIEIGRPLVKAISPVSVAMMCIFVFCANTVLPDIPADYFHSGESLLPWQQLWDFHAVPYVDFAPVHGLMEILRGALNQLFFDGSFRHYDQAYILVSGLAAAAIALSAAELFTPIGALFLLLTALPDMDRMYFVAPPLFIIAAPRLLSKPVAWLAIWVLLGFFSCAYNPAMGPAFVLGTIPISIWQAYRALRTQRGWFAVFVGVILAIAAIAFGVHQIKLVGVGFVRFILDNQWTNESANGIAWSQGEGMRDKTYGIGSTQFLWEVVRFGWIPLVIAAAIIYWKQWSKPREQRDLSVMVLSAAIPPVLLWSCLWVIERLDPGIPGRSGTITQVALFTLTPALLFLTLEKRNAGLITLLLATFVGFVYPEDQPTAIDPGLLVQKAIDKRIIYPGWRVVDGYSAGLPRMGQVIWRVPDITVNIINLKKDLTQWLKPGETFLDLSDASALYYYLDLRCPVQYASYVAGNARLQGEMMRQLKQHPVPVVLIAPTGWIDFVPMSLRCYRPYHDYVLKYAVVSKDGFTFLVDPSRVPGVGPVGSESQLAMLDPIFRRENLLRLPLAWGESWTSMKDRFASVASVAAPRKVPLIHGQPSSVTWSIPPEASTGQAADFVRFHCEFSATNPGAYKIVRRKEAIWTSASDEPQLSVTWTNADGTSSAPIIFKGQAGDLIVPLGTCPRWLLGSGFRTLTVTLQNSGSAKEMSLSGLEFLRLKPL